MTTLKCKNLSKSFGNSEIISSVSFEISSGDFLIMTGPSGSGKSTLLKMLAGIIDPDTGSIYIDEDDVTNTPPEKRPTVMIWQDLVLFPHLNVYDNIKFALLPEKLPAEERKRRINDILRILKIESLKQRAIANLSGGEKQRVAIGRALVKNPKVLFMDEPLGALDAKLRRNIMDFIADYCKRNGIPAIMVTHDLEEGISIGNRFALIEKGVLLLMDNLEFANYFR